MKNSRSIYIREFCGAGSGGRTRTVSLPLDFESSTSANSIIPALPNYIIIFFMLLQDVFEIFLEIKRF